MKPPLLALAPWLILSIALSMLLPARSLAQSTAREQVINTANRLTEGDRLLEQGIEQFQAHQIADAIQSLQAALSLFQAIENQQKIVEALNQIGLVFFTQGEYQPAQAAHAQALAIAQSIQDRQGEAVAANGIGNALTFLQQEREAIPFHETALNVAREYGLQQEEARALNGLGNAYSGLKEYEPARTFYETSLEVSRAIGFRAGEARAITNLAGLYARERQYEPAIRFNLQALDLSRQADDPKTESATLYNLGRLYTNVGQFQKALQVYEQALVIYQTLGDHAWQGQTLSVIGVAYRNLNQHERAIEYHLQSLAIAQKLGDRFLEAVSYGNLGVSSNFLGRHEQAIEFHQQALAIYQAIEFREGEGLTLGNLGLAYSDLGDFQQAIEFYNRSLTIARELSDRLREGNALNNIGAAHFGLGQLENSTQAALEAIQVYETYLRSGLDDSSSISIFDTYARSFRLAQTALVAQGKFEAALEIAEQSRARAFIDSLTAKSSGTRASHAFTSTPNRFSSTSIRQIAQQQAATLVQYSIVSGVEDALYIWVIKPTGEIQFQSINLATLDRPLSELVQVSRDTIGARGRSTATISTRLTPAAQQQQSAAQRQNLRQLHQLLIDPIAPYLPANQNERVIFIPQGELFLVPFAALLDANGQYLIEQHTILTAPSIQVLGLTHQQRQQLGPGSADDEMLVVGNPTMPDVWNPATGDTEQLPNLQGAEAEAVAIAAAFQTEPLLSSKATETTVKQQMQRARFIHLATHGLLEYGDPQQSGVQDFPGAIALAASAEDDGLLTASEIYSMALKAELVVLSACDTGRGYITGDGVIGLSRSLMQAGVPSVAVSLWKVPDEPTAALMVQFYRNLQQTPDKAQALRQAMLTTMQQYPDPINWAAFTLIGEAE